MPRFIHLPPPPFPALLTQVIILVMALYRLNQLRRNIIAPLPAWIAQFLFNLPLLLRRLCQPALLTQLIPGYQPVRNHGRYIFPVLCQQPHLFWYTTGETIESFEQIVNSIRFEVKAPRSVSRLPRTNRCRRCLLDVQNRVLLAIMWLRIYPTYRTIAAFFSIKQNHCV